MAENLEIKILDRTEVVEGIKTGKLKRLGVGKIPNNFAMWHESSRDMYLRQVAKQLQCDIIALPISDDGEDSKVLYCKTNTEYKT
jgi:hypothetical protein